MSCELINRAHLAGVSTSHAVWRHFAATLDVSHQQQPPQHFVDEVLDASIRNPCVLSAPRDPKHTREVVAWLAEQWRLRRWTVPSEFQLDSFPDVDDTVDLFYKTYTGWGGGPLGPGITLMESSGGITRSTTGLTTWCGAAVLAEWVANNPTVVAGKRVLELGGGVGFSASAILTSPDTEHLPPSSYLDGQGCVGVMQVDWRHPPRLPPVDVVLAADVVYCRNLIQPLVSLLRSILEGSDGQKEQRQPQQEAQRDSGEKGCNSEEEMRATDGGGLRKQEAFLACTRRSHETLSLFLQEVTRQGLQYTLVFQASMDADTALFVYNEIHLPVKVYKITLPREDTREH